jgi:hypothetical protein
MHQAKEIFLLTRGSRFEASRLTHGPHQTSHVLIIVEDQESLAGHGLSVTLFYFY